MGREQGGRAGKGRVEYLNPAGMLKNPAFTQVAVVSGAARTVYVGGQDAVDAQGQVVGKGDMVAQAEQVFRNLETALAAAGAGLEHIVKWNIYVRQGQPVQEGVEVFRRVWAQRSDPPVITVVFVAGLGHPDFLLELEAIAVVPE